MESPLTTNDLNHLLARLTDNCYLDTNDRSVLERGTKAIGSLNCSSEMANTVNQIWKVLSQLTDNYWNIIGFVACSDQINTKAMAVISMSEQIGGERGKFMSEEMK